MFCSNQFIQARNCSFTMVMVTHSSLELIHCHLNSEHDSQYSEWTIVRSKIIII